MVTIYIDPSSLTIGNVPAYVGLEIAYPYTGSFLKSPYNLDPSGNNLLIIIRGSAGNLDRQHIILWYL